jgi:NADPH-dependent 2,4-dienoyl-CoA reductase/sulfur reductase-like enzyme
VRLADGTAVPYDRVIVSPGVDLMYDDIPGLREPAARERVLHAWKAGPQTLALRKQLEAMRDGGVYAITIPRSPYRCPPGPYERACQIAWFLKTRKPRAKLIVLDANNDIVSKAALFKAAFRMYPNLDYRPTSKLEKVDLGTQEVTPAIGDRVRYDLLNLIPPQRAGTIAVQADLVNADRRWCEVNHVTYESLKHPGIHVIGDATTGLPVPKSGNIANAMGKICATAVVHLLDGKEPPVLAPGNTCYSWTSDAEAIAVVNAYRIDNGKVVQIEQKLTPRASVAVARNSIGWRASIWADVLG